MAGAGDPGSARLADGFFRAVLFLGAVVSCTVAALYAELACAVHDRKRSKQPIQNGRVRRRADPRKRVSSAQDDRHSPEAMTSCAVDVRVGVSAKGKAIACPRTWWRSKTACVKTGRKKGETGVSAHGNCAGAPAMVSLSRNPRAHALSAATILSAGAASFGLCNHVQTTLTTARSRSSEMPSR